jgi:high-affinity nickel permease
MKHGNFSRYLHQNKTLKKLFEHIFNSLKKSIYMKTTTFLFCTADTATEYQFFKIKMLIFSSISHDLILEAYLLVKS